MLLHNVISYCEYLEMRNCMCWNDEVNWNDKRQYIIIYISVCPASSFVCLLDNSWDTSGDEVSHFHSRIGSSTTGVTNNSTSTINQKLLERNRDMPYSNSVFFITSSIHLAENLNSDDRYLRSQKTDEKWLLIIAKRAHEHPIERLC